MWGAFTYWLTLTWFYTKEIIINRYFLLILVAGLSFMLLGITGVFERFGLTAYPVTYVVLETLDGNFELFLLIMITFFSGELIWKEREARLNEFYAVLPVSTAVQMLARFAAILLMVLFIFLILWITGVVVQLNSGRVEIDMGLYLKSFLFMQLGYHILMTALVFLVHIVINHKYQAHALLIIYFFFRATILPQFGFDHHLYLYGTDPGMVYSDFFGFDYHREAFWWFRIYWSLLAAVFMVVAYLFWPMGVEDTFRSRFRRGRRRLTRPVLFTGILLIAFFVSTGGYIFYNTNILNDYQPLQAIYAKEAAYEKQYKAFEKIAQPDVISTFLNVDLRGQSRDMQVEGHYFLKNYTEKAIDSIHVQVPNNAIVYQTPLRMEESFEVKHLELSEPSSAVLEDRVHNYFILQLENPLLPGDSVRLNFSMDYTTTGFRNQSNPHLDVLSNGTLFYSMYWPRIGYNNNMELKSDRLRKQYGLGPSIPMPKPGTPGTEQSQPVATRLVISSDSGHTTVASGELIAEYQDNGRTYREFQAACLPGFLSGTYEQSNFVAEGIEVSLLYLRKHDFNIERFKNAIAKALKYGTEQFGRLPLKQLYFVEYPRYAGHAVSFPGMIAYPELGFIENYEKDVEIDRLGRVTAHEVTHQWWGNQLETDAVQGSTMLTESLAEYASLMYLKHHRSLEEVARHLRVSQQSYLRLRGSESKHENPLMYVQGQNYLHYNKGACVFYALQDYLGEESLNAVLRDYYQDYLKKEIRSAHSLELYEYIKRATPESLSTVVADLVERITLYELKTESADVVELPDGHYELTLVVTAQKFYADGIGNESEAALQEWIDIGVYAESNELIYLKKHFFDQRESTIRLVLDKAPERAGIDPMGILIDKHFEDNMQSVTTRSTQSQHP